MTETTRPPHPIGIDKKPRTIVLYVRSDVSAASRRQIDGVTERLEALAETPLGEEVRLEQWPPQHSIGTAAGAGQSPRGELVGEFKPWATDRDVSLRPAIRRQVVPGSLVGAGDAYSEVRVPVMTLGLYAEDTDDLCGVVHGRVPGGRTDDVHRWRLARRRRDGSTGRALRAGNRVRGAGLDGVAGAA
jgi:hypothetical protein